MNRPKPHPVRRFVASGLAALMLLVVAACAPILTQKPYAASDGIRIELGESVVIENLLVVTEAEGAPGLLQGAVRNDGADTAVLLGDLMFEIPANETLMLSGDNAEVVTLPSVNAAPGSVLNMQVAADGFVPQEVPVPVLDGTLPEYAKLLEEFSTN